MNIFIICEMYEIGSSTAATSCATLEDSVRGRMYEIASWQLLNLRRETLNLIFKLDSRVKIITLFFVLDTQFAKKQGHDLNHDPQES
jgi:hypothetical protein